MRLKKTFNLQIDEVDVPETNEDSTEEPSGETIESTTIEVIERIEEAVEEEPTASGRLASLREEMGTDSGVEREGSLEDRMSKFFGDDGECKSLFRSSDEEIHDELAQSSTTAFHTLDAFNGTSLPRLFMLLNPPGRQQRSVD